jgi:ABC-type branched-subunit amino acid transport system permease subunit
VIGTVLAGLAGVVGAPVLNSLEINNYNIAMFIAAAAVVLGGLRSVPLAFAGGLFLGIAQSLVGNTPPIGCRLPKTFPGSELGAVRIAARRPAVRPSRPQSTGRQCRHATTADQLVDDLPRWRVQLPWVIAVVVFFVFSMFIVDDVWVGLFANGSRTCGRVHEFRDRDGPGRHGVARQSAFVMVAAFVTGRFMVQYNWPWILALVVGVAVAMILGIIVSLPALRLGGLALALATLALGFLGDEVLFKWNWLRRSQAVGTIAARHRSCSASTSGNSKPAVIALMIIVGLLTVLVPQSAEEREWDARSPPSAIPSRRPRRRVCRSRARSCRSSRCRPRWPGLGGCSLPRATARSPTAPS